MELPHHQLLVGASTPCSSSPRSCASATWRRFPSTCASSWTSSRESFAGEPRFRLHQQNYRQVRHILARLTHWVDSQCGVASHFEDLISEGRGRPFEIEHIWADKYERFTDWFAHPSDFETERNRIGGLVLLQRGINQSLGDATYEQKRDAYATHSANLLARSLHPLAYQNNPAFPALIDRTGLPFRAYEPSGPRSSRSAKSCTSASPSGCGIRRGLISTARSRRCTSPSAGWTMRPTTEPMARTLRGPAGVLDAAARSRQNAD